MPSLSAHPTALAGAGAIGSLILRDSEGRQANQRVQIDLILEKDGVQSVVTSMRNAIGTRALKGDIEKKGNDSVRLNGKTIRVHDQSEIPVALYESMGIKRVIEATGRRTKSKEAAAHMEGTGVEQVLVTANGGEDMTHVVVGINEDRYIAKPKEAIANASCTTKSTLAVLKKVQAKTPFSARA